MTELTEVGARLDRRDNIRKLLEVRMFEMLDDAILVVDRASEIILANPAAELLFLYPRDKLVGMHVSDLVPESKRAEHAKHVAGFFAAPRARQMGNLPIPLNIAALRRDGQEIAMVISLSPLVADELLTVVVARRRQSVAT
jgi:PAS domain S-box-containing protein